LSSNDRELIKTWVLSSIAIKQLHLHQLDDGARISVNADQIANDMPRSMMAHVNVADDIIRSLYELKKHGYLEYINGEQEFANFRITTNGIIFFKKYLAPIVSTINQGNYEKIIDNTEGDIAAKNELKAIKKNLKDKTEDQVIEEFVKFGFKYGPTAIVLFMKLIESTQH